MFHSLPFLFKGEEAIQRSLTLRAEVKVSISIFLPPPPENADDVAEHILNLVNKSTALDEEETKIIVSKVTDISNCDDISANLTQMILQIISTVMEKQSDSASNLPPVSNK